MPITETANMFSSLTAVLQMKRLLALALAVPFLTWSEGTLAQTAGEAAPAENVAAVTIDGNDLFMLRGVSAFPAEVRAAAVRQRIISRARDQSFAPESLTIAHSEGRSDILAGDQVVMTVLDEDAEIEGLDRKLLAEVYRVRIQSGVEDYRHDRSPAVLLRNAGIALLATLVAAVLLWGVLRGFRWLENWTERHVQRNIERLASKSHELLHAGQAWRLVIGLLRLLRLLLLILLAYFFLNTVLGLFPWTRPAAGVLFRLVLNPLESLWLGFVGTIPSLAFLVILFFVFRYLFKLIRAFFVGIEQGRIRLENFDPDWAIPTFKIVRFILFIFALVIAYPYIPGSDSLAFKGVSVFIGVLLSLGSSSFIANMIAGLAMTYRGAFKEEDVVRIGDVVGKVEEIKLMTTRIRTPKNESVILPNSNILNTNVTNLSHLARETGVILHTTVSIGYDTPWRQVEAMLLLAADRTGGLKKDPPPFVLQRALGDFAVTYELNAYCGDVARMLVIYSGLHANILDVFNEHEVQIMTPAYEGDTEMPKIVPKANWFAAPARKPET